MDATRFVVWATVGLGSVVLLVGTLTLGIAVRKHRETRRIEAVKSTITVEMFSRLNEDDPAWEAWIEGLPSHERAVVRKIGKRLLREVHGSERAELQKLVLALGVAPERLRIDIESGGLYRKLRALSWLALLEYPSVVNAALRTRTWCPDVRTATARVLYETGDPRAKRTGVDLLVWEGSKPLSVFGLDTLYQITTRNPDYLLSLASDEHREWNDAVLIQVLTVLQYCQTGIRPSSLAWVPTCLDHDSPEVRAAALSTLAEYGWSKRLRDAVAINEYLTDPSPKVRRVAYEVLDMWGDEDFELLESAVYDEPDDLARLVGVRVLQERTVREQPIDGTSEAFERTWRWVGAERATALEHV